MSSSGWPIRDSGIDAVFERLLFDGSWGQYNGPHCLALQAALREYQSVEHVHLCSSGTCAMELALRAAGVSAGDEVILAAYDFKANFVNVLLLDAKPVLVDIRPHSPVMVPEQVAAAVTARTRAVVVSHLHGALANPEAIRAAIVDPRIVLIEDACQNPGALINGRRAGSLGDLGVLSFGGSKLLTAGRGGAVLTADARLAQRIHLHVQRGNDAYPLSEFQAAIVLPQLERLDERNALRHESARLVFEELHGCEYLSPGLDLPHPLPPGMQPAWYKVPLLLNPDLCLRTREALAEEMAASGISLQPGFSALHQIHAKSRYRVVGPLDHAEEYARRIMVLHHPVLLQSHDHVRAMAREIRRIASGSSC